MVEKKLAKLANHDASSHTVDKATDKEVLRSHVDRMVEEKLANQRKQTQGNTRPPGGGQGAGAKRKLAQLQKHAAATAPCEHCGKKHAGECWYKPGGKKRIKAEKKALKAVEESAERVCVLFIGTQFSILYTSMYSPAGAALDVCGFV
jgi:hypothetical protein